MQVPGRGPEGREGLPLLPRFVGFGTGPEPLSNGPDEAPPPFSPPPGDEFDALPPGFPPPGLPDEAGSPTPPITLPEFRPPPSLGVVTGGSAAGDPCMGPEGGFNGSEEGSPLPAEADGLFFSGLSGDLGFAASVKSGRFPPTLGREALTGGSLFGGSGEGVSGSLAIGLLGVSGELKSS
jgi:hypothetical protein